MSQLPNEDDIWLIFFWLIFFISRDPDWRCECKLCGLLGWDCGVKISLNFCQNPDSPRTNRPWDPGRGHQRVRALAGYLRESAQSPLSSRKVNTKNTSVVKSTIISSEWPPSTSTPRTFLSHKKQNSGPTLLAPWKVDFKRISAHICTLFFLTR